MTDRLHILNGFKAPPAKFERPASPRENMTETDADYYERRSREEQLAAQAARDEHVRKLHMELSSRFAGRAASVRDGGDK